MSELKDAQPCTSGEAEILPCATASKRDWSKGSASGLEYTAPGH